MRRGEFWSLGNSLRWDDSEQRLRLNSDGTIDTTFNQGTGFNSLTVSALMTPDGSGKIYVVGNFTTYNGTSAGRIIRLNSDGTVDATFNSGTGFDSEVWTINPAVDGSGALFVGGYFGHYNGVAVGGIARLKPDGSLDTSLVQGTGYTYAWGERGTDPLVGSILPMTDGSGRIYAAGTYRHYNGTAITNFSRLGAAGVLDSLNQGTGFAAGSTYLVTSAFAPDGSGKIYVGGFFAGFNGTPLGDIARLNADGSLDTFGRRSPVSPGFNNWVMNIAPTTDGSGRIYVGGLFTTYEGVNTPYLARLHADGTLDTTFNNGGTGFNAGISQILVSNDGSGKIYVAGSFGSYNGTNAPFVARLTRDGALE